RVAVEAGGSTPVLENLLGQLLGGAAGSFRVRVRCREYDQASLQVVRNIGAALGQCVHSGEIPHVPDVVPDAPFQLAGDLVRVTAQLLGAVPGQLAHRRLGGVPGARAVLVEVGRLRGEAAQRIAEQGR